MAWVGDPRSAAASEALAGPELHVLWEDMCRLRNGQSRFHDLTFRALREVLDASPGDTLVDAGCGPGHHAIRLAREGWHVKAFDFSPAAVERARVEVQRAGVDDRVEIHQEDLLELSLADESERYVMCWGVLMHIPDIDRAVAELSRVVESGGKLVVSELNMRSPESRAIRAVGRRRRGGSETRTPSGVEQWQATNAGHLLIRHADPDWLVRQFGRHGLTTRGRFAGQVTESHNYTHRRSPRLTKLIDRLNETCLWSPAMAHIAMGNIFVFEKS